MLPRHLLPTAGQPVQFGGDVLCSQLRGPDVRDGRVWEGRDVWQLWGLPDLHGPGHVSAGDQRDRVRDLHPRRQHAAMLQWRLPRSGLRPRWGT
jgi:hypothetical protein